VWSKRGECTCRYDFFLRGTKYSILPALSLDGIKHLEVIENAITGNDFRHFVQGLLSRMNEFPLPKSVLVIDNVSIHKVAGICELVEEHDVRLLYLPPYSPDFNPIELAFSSIKPSRKSINYIRFISICSDYVYCDLSTSTDLID
jgi:transposase